MDDKLQTTIQKVVQLTKQNPEFDAELRQALGSFKKTIASLSNDERIGQIYEYCIEDIVRKQAKDFYSDFPIPSIIPILAEDFIRMESFRRKDNFPDFCLALYQQIECMTNQICKLPSLHEITSKMWGYAAYIKVTEKKEVLLSERSSSEYSIAKLVLGINYAEKATMAIQGQYAMDKIRTIVYFLGYKALMKNEDYNGFREVTSLLSDIYQCRNMNHRGNTLNQWEEEIQNRILPLKSLYYFKFMGVLAQFVSFIKDGYVFLPQLETFAKSIEVKKIIAGPKVVGKIELPDDGRQRFKRS